jgi:ELWxxDGT repeat protein
LKISAQKSKNPRFSSFLQESRHPPLFSKVLMKNLLQTSINSLTLVRTPISIGITRLATVIALAFCLLHQKAVIASDYTLTRITNGAAINSNFFPLNIVPFNGKIYFSGNVLQSSNSTRYLCVTSNDPTSGFTVLNPAPAGCFNPTEFTPVGTKVYFAADDNVNGRELWVTDGTLLGTRMVRNIANGNLNSNPSNLTPFGDKLLFVASDPVNGKELWITDGTENGTDLVRDIFPGNSSSDIGPIFVWNGVAYFSASDQTNNAELWRSNGTLDGTKRVIDISSSNSFPQRFTPFNGKLFFQAKSGPVEGAELWQTDGTEAGTKLVRKIISSAPIKEMHVVGSHLFFSAPREAGEDRDYELWRSNGTLDGTELVTNINPNGPSNPKDFATFNNQLYFVANDGSNGDQIWRSNGTEAGTEMVHSPVFNPVGKPHPNPRALFPFGNKLFFAQALYSIDPTKNFGLEWFSTDGTPNGIQLVADIAPGEYNGLEFRTNERTHVIHDNELYFSAFAQLYAMEIWKFTKDLEITTQPQPRLVLVNQSVNFSVAYTPSGGTVQWQKNRSNISGANGLSYSIAKAALSHSGAYRARVSRSGTTKTSTEATLGVVDPAVASASANPGGTLQFQVSAAGTGLTYRWRKNGTALSNDSGGRITGVTTATLQVKNVTSADIGNYTCTVSLGSLSVTTNAASGAILAVPVLTASPSSTLVHVGQTLSLTTSARGTALSYQWYQNGSAIAGATSNTFTVTKATAAAAGKYHCRISNGAGSINTANAFVVLLDRPVPGASIKETGSFTLQATIHIPSGAPAVSYRWRKSSSYVADGARISGSNTPTLVVKNAVTADSALYLCRVTFAGVTLDTAGASVAVLGRPVINAVAAQTWSISQAVSLKVTGTHSPSKYIASGLPAGLQLDQRSGQLTGVPTKIGSGTIRVAAENVAGRGETIAIAYSIVALPAGVVGTFDGLIARHSVIGNSLGGHVTMVVSSTGSISGSMRMEGRTYRFTSRLRATAGSDPIALIPVAQKDASWTIRLNFDSASQRASGELDDGRYGTSVRVDRRTWHARSNPASTWAGTYNMTMGVPEALKGNNAYPQGMSYARFTLTTSGAVRISGRMGEGTPFTLSTQFWRERYIPIYVSMHNHMASLRGLIRINSGGAAPLYPDNRVVVSKLDWMKMGPASASDRLYRNGFGIIYLEVDGSKWVAPPKGVNVMEQEDTGSQNVNVAFAYGGLSSADRSTINQSFRMDATSRCYFDRTVNQGAVKFSFNKQTGLWSGAFKLQNPNPAGGRDIVRNVTCQGLILQHTHYGHGNFRLPRLPNPSLSPPTTSANSDILGGVVLIRPR